MKFKKGVSGNPKGRAKGKPNKITTDLRTAIKEFLDNNFNEVTELWVKMDARDKLSFYKDLIRYVVAPLQYKEPEQEQTPFNIVIEHVHKPLEEYSDKELEKLSVKSKQELIKKLNLSLEKELK
ncbi:MAG: hypothetical protein KA792_06810 [Bacteroidales bacterium]|nr:hypothetical protein [Bacteroidales bacterium]